MLTITITQRRMVGVSYLITNRRSTRGQIKTIFLTSSIERGSSITSMSTDFLAVISGFFHFFSHQIFTCNFTHFSCIATTPSSSAGIITCLSSFTNDPFFSLNRNIYYQIQFLIILLLIFKFSFAWKCFYMFWNAYLDCISKMLLLRGVHFGNNFLPYLCSIWSFQGFPFGASPIHDRHLRKAFCPLLSLLPSKFHYLGFQN